MNIGFLALHIQYNTITHTYVIICVYIYIYIYIYIYHALWMKNTKYIPFYSLIILLLNKETLAQHWLNTSPIQYVVLYVLTIIDEETIFCVCHCSIFLIQKVNFVLHFKKLFSLKPITSRILFLHRFSDIAYRLIVSELIGN